MLVTDSPCSFSKKYCLIMPLDQNPHQTVTPFVYAGGFSVPQMRQFCLFTYPKRSKWASSKKMIFLGKSASSVSRSQALHCSNVSFVRRKDKTDYLLNQTWAKCYHSRNEHKLKETLDGGPSTMQSRRAHEEAAC